MEYSYYLGLFLVSLLIMNIVLFKRLRQENLPPGPPGLPILGHYHLLKSPFYRFSKTLFDKYGQILFLRFGLRPVLVVSTPSAVEECFTKNDLIFANRPLFPSRKAPEYNFTTMSMAPYGHHWRNLRRFTAIEIFSSARLEMSAAIRAEEINFLVKQLFENSFKSVPCKVEMRMFFYMLTFNVMMKMTSGCRCFEGEFAWDSTIDMVNDLRKMFSPQMKLLLGDYFSILRWLPFYKAKKEGLELHRKRDQFLKDLIDSSRNAKSSGETRRTLMDTMFSLQESEPHIYTEDVIKGIILVMLVSGTAPLTSTMESAVSHLIANPEVLNKVREEVETNIGESRLLNESDLTKLPFLHCIINETLRLGSAGPIIPPHESSEKCKVGGYDIPRGTMLLVNVWAMYMDPKLWEDPHMFKPERFQGNQEEKGEFKYIPFGVGRRQCPGAGLAMRLMALTLGILIQCFEWENADITTTKSKTEDELLRVIFRPRHTLVQALSQL